MNYKNKKVYIEDIEKNKRLIVNNLKVADNFFTRLKGLLGTKEIKETEGLLFSRCNQIHMFFMKYPIDVIYCDKSLNILHITRNIQPWKIDKFVKGAYYTLEIKANSINNEIYNKLIIE